MGSTQIDSHLVEKLPEYLNAEIALKTITDVDETAMQWLRTTFHYACIAKSLPKNEADAKLKGTTTYLTYGFNFETQYKVDNLISAEKKQQQQQKQN